METLEQFLKKQLEKNLDRPLSEADELLGSVEKCQVARNYKPEEIGKYCVRIWAWFDGNIYDSNLVFSAVRDTAEEAVDAADSFLYDNDVLPDHVEITHVKDLEEP